MRTSIYKDGHRLTLHVSFTNVGGCQRPEFNSAPQTSLDKTFGVNELSVR
jgi:hypothetical protein